MKITISTIGSCTSNDATNGNQRTKATTVGRLYMSSTLWLDVVKEFKIPNVITTKSFIELRRSDGMMFLAIPTPVTTVLRDNPYTFDGLIGPEKWSSSSLEGEEYKITSILPPAKLPILPFVKVLEEHPFLNGIPCKSSTHSWIGSFYLESASNVLSIITEQTKQILIRSEYKFSQNLYVGDAILKLEAFLANDPYPIHLRGPKGSGKTEAYRYVCEKFNIKPLLYRHDLSLKSFHSSLLSLKEGGGEEGRHRHVFVDDADLLGEDELSFMKQLIKLGKFKITTASRSLKHDFLGDLITFSCISDGGFGNGGNGSNSQKTKNNNTTTLDSWDKLGGISGVKKRIEEAIVWPLTHTKELALMGIKKPKGILMHGPPGCSKTTIARLIASGVGDFTFLPVSGASLYSCWVGESEHSLRDLFERAREDSPSLIFIDEIDALVGNRGFASGGGGGGDQVQERILSTLLNEMDGIDDRNGDVLVLAATNRLDKIDSALKRPGRFDIILEIPLPDLVGRIEIMKAITSFGGALRGKIALKGEESEWEGVFEKIGQRTDGWSGALLKNLFQEAAMKSIRDDLPSIPVHVVMSILDS